MEVKVLSAVVPYVAPDEAIAREWVSPSNSRAEKMSLAEITIPPGVKVTPHYHLECEETYFVFSGEGQMELGAERRLLKAGEAVVILPGERHTIANESASPLKMWVTCVPAWRMEDQVFVD